MGADTDRGIVGDFEGVLPEYARAGLVRAGQQHASIGEDLDERIGRVGPALVVQAEIAHDAFVRPATTQETGPNEAGRVSARRAAGSNGRKYVSTVLAGIEQSHAVAVAVVVPSCTVILPKMSVAGTLPSHGPNVPGSRP